MECDEADEANKGYVYCAHCNNVVSRSTFQRHERKRYLAASMNESGPSKVASRNSESESSSSPDDEEFVLEEPSVVHASASADSTPEAEQKLTRRTSALEMVNWRNAHKKGKAAEVLLLDAMSSEESCYEDGDEDRKVVRYQVKRLSWESRKLRKTKNKLDKAYKKSLTKRAQERILERTVAPGPSQRQPPDGIPEWAVQE